MTSQEYIFPKERYNLLVDSTSELIKILESLKFLLKSKNEGENRIATYFDQDSKNVYSLDSQFSNSNFIEITELAEENRRMLRYAFRDWKASTIESIRGTKLYDAIDKHQLLDIDNIKLFSIPGSWDEFEWKVCIGFHFNSYGDNFLPDNVGPFKPLVVTPHANTQLSQPHSSVSSVDVVDTTKTTDMTSSSNSQEVHADLNSVAVSSPKSQSKSGLRYWVDTNWRWILSFCLGFLIASILSWLITNCCGCDFSDRLQELLSIINQN